MDCQMGYRQQRPAEIYGRRQRIERVGAAEHYAPGYRQRTVEPGIEYRGAIDFGVEPDHTAVACHLGPGLDAEAGRIAVSRDNVESGFGTAVADDKRHQSARVLHDIAAVAGLKNPCVAFVERLEAIGLQQALGCLHSQKIYRRGVEERHQLIHILAHNHSKSVNGAHGLAAKIQIIQD